MLAQVFNLDASIVNNSGQVQLSKIDLYFRSKPNRTQNRSGINSPGVTVFITNTVNQVPVLNPSQLEEGFRIIRYRLNYDDILISADASLATTLKLNMPLILRTGKSYALVTEFDGDEDFVLWKAKAGETLVNTNVVNNNINNPYIGPLYSTTLPSNNNNSIQNLLLNWTPYNNQAIKFNLYIARYALNGVFYGSNSSINYDSSYNNSSNITVEYSGNKVIVNFDSLPKEFISYDINDSVDTDYPILDKIFQVQPYYSGGKITPVTVRTTQYQKNVISNAFTLANGAAFNWNYLIPDPTVNTFIVFVSENHSSGIDLKNVRKVVSVSNTSITLDEPLYFTNTACKFYIAPVAEVEQKITTLDNGVEKFILVLKNTSVNNSVKFVNNSIKSVSITGGGSSYSNSDYIEFTGYESVSNKVIGGYKGIANLQTNSTGGIVNVYVTNSGAGFVNASALIYTFKANSTSNSTGTNANLSIEIGSTLKTQIGMTSFNNITVENISINEFIPTIDMENISGTDYVIKHKSYYYSTEDGTVLSGIVPYTFSDALVQTYITRNGEKVEFSNTYNIIIPSRSNQFNIPYSNGSVANVSINGNRYGHSRTIIEYTSNNDFCAVTVNPRVISNIYGKYLINNDYTNEHTNYGNAYSKHITNKANFKEDRFAEDLIVTLTAYRPSNTDLKVYARLHNSNDEEAFDDKDWTLLEQTDGIDVYSSLSNPDDFKEYTFGLSQYPNSAFTVNGFATTSLSNNVIIGSNTNFSNLASNDLIKIYSSLFPENYIIDVVDTVTNAEYMTVKNLISNNGLVGTGFKIDKIDFKNQVFRNITNDNVARYYNTSGAEFDTFNTFQLKVVFLSNDDKIVPKVDDIEAIGVTS